MHVWRSLVSLVLKFSVCNREAEWVAPSRWHIAMALYIISFVTYGVSLVFFAAAFPRLARNTPYLWKLRGRYENGDISAEEYEREESLEKNRITNISTVSFLSRWLDWYYGLPGAQQCWLRRHFCSEHHITATSWDCRWSSSQQICYCTVKLYHCWLCSMSSDLVGSANTYWVLLGVWWCTCRRLIYRWY